MTVCSVLFPPLAQSFVSCMNCDWCERRLKNVEEKFHLDLTGEKAVFTRLFSVKCQKQKKIIPGLGDDSEGLLPLFCVLRFTDYDHKHKPSNLSTGKPEKPSEISLFVVFKQPLVQKMSMKTNSRLWSIVSSTACMKLYLLSVCLFLFFLLDWSV